MKDGTKRIILLGTNSGGTTAVSKCFLQHNQIMVVSEVIKFGGNGAIEKFYSMRSLKPIIYTKETFGYKKQYCKYKLFPSGLPHDVHAILLFRNPISVWNSWVRRGWGLDIDNLITSYVHLSSFLPYCKNHEISHSVILFEEFISNPSFVLREVCASSGIEYQSAMTNWAIPWGSRRGNRGNPNIDRESLRTQLDNRNVLSSTTQDLINRRLGAIWSSVVKNYGRLT